MLLNMAVKIALAVGLFSVICVIPGLKSSQVVPEGLVYTEVKRTLVRGVQGVLTCRFFGDPIAVYWRKGIDPDDLSSMIVWYDGKVSGPRYDDGSCDMDENYSLIINNVSTADSGRMYCTVSNNKGPLMNNYTDILVVDTAITTNPLVTLQLRQATYGILQCTVHITARRVTWKKGITSSATESLVVMESNQRVAERNGAGYHDGTYNITRDYSLVIKELQIHHEGLYVCEVTDDTGISFRNHTLVNVVAQPPEPFPTIQECLNAEQHDSNYCTLVAKSGMTLTCQATKYYPTINLVFLYGSIVVEHSDTEEWENKDGTKNKTITIATRGNRELYTCVASSIPGTNVNKSTSILLQGGEPGKSTLVTILVYFALMLILNSYFIWRLIRCIEARKRMDETLMQLYIRIIGPIDKKCTDIIRENRTSLVDTHQIITDWQPHRRTSTRVKETINIENEPDDTWPYNEELKTISRHLTQESMKKVCKKLDINFQCDDANDEGKRLETLRKWRSKESTKPKWDTWEQLFSALESNNLGVLLPTLRGPYIYKAEIVDLAFNLLMEDVCPVAKELGINVTKSASYRPVFKGSYLDIGAIKLLIDLYTTIGDTSHPFKKRSDFCKTIANFKYDNVATGMIEYNMSYGELCSISEAINQNLEGRADQETSGMLQGPGIPESLQNVLQLTDQDIDDRLDTSNPFALLKIWKEKLRPSVFNYRAALAHELRRNKMPGLADEVAAGKYMNEGTSFAFIEDMVRGLKQDKLDCLENIIKLSGTDVHWPTNTPSDMISKEIHAWVAKWTTAMANWRKVSDKQRVTTGGANVVAGGTVMGRMNKSMPHEHRDLNDRLVEHGFLDLAREIMIIEQRSVAGLLT